jgi:hypothetical protein
MSSYLVYFLTDEVDDEQAHRVAERVRKLAADRVWGGASPGFVDSAEEGEGAERTTGGYLLLGDEFAGADVVAMWTEVVAVSRELGVSVEVQFREEVLGRVHSGEPEEGLEQVVLGLA